MERAGKGIKNADVIDYALNTALAYFDSSERSERKAAEDAEARITKEYVFKIRESIPMFIVECIEAYLYSLSLMHESLPIVIANQQINATLTSAQYSGFLFYLTGIGLCYEDCWLDFIIEKEVESSETHDNTLGAK